MSTTSNTATASAVPPANATQVIPKPHPSASLYVGDLHPSVTEGMLFEIFSQIGPLASIRVCRDTLTRRSLGYAYVNFHTVVDAERALDTLNNHPIKGRPCRIMWSQRDPSVRKSGVGNIFIKNLDPAIGHKELNDTFSAFGNILSCKVAMDENGNSKGFGFVHFENAESADKAIEVVNDKLLGSKKVFVGKFQPKKERRKQKDSSWTNVYIKDLDPNVTENDLVNLFSEHGHITSCAVMRKVDNASLGFGFVNFDRHENAQKAVEQLHQHSVLGKPIWCCRAQKKSERLAELQQKFKQHKIEQFNKFQGVNLYIKNLEDDIDEERLKKEFSVFGQIRSAKIMEDAVTHNSKGFGFICFTSADEAQITINEMNGRILSGCSKPLYVALHEPKDIRRQKLAQRHAPQRKIRPNANAPVPPVYTGFYQPTGSPPFVYHQPQMQATRPTSRPPWSTSQQPPLHMHPTAATGQYIQGRTLRGGRQQAMGGRAARVGGRRPNQPGLPPDANAPDGLSLAQLSTFPPDQQKLLLGERLYPLIQKTQSELAGKITGMLLDSGWNTEELFSFLDDEDKLLQKIDEAVIVLNKAADLGTVVTGAEPTETGDER